MPIPVEWDITHRCGHTVRKNLAHKAAGQRAGTARWFAKHRDCTPCETAALAAEAEADGMPALTGRDGAVQWAVRIRQQFLRTAFQDLVDTDQMPPEQFHTDVLERARQVTSARWWIENRDLPAVDLPELLADPGPGASTPPAPHAGVPLPPAPPASREWVSFFDQKADPR